MGKKHPGSLPQIAFLLHFPMFKYILHMLICKRSRPTSFCPVFHLTLYNIFGGKEKGTTEGEMAGWHHRLDGQEFE